LAAKKEAEFDRARLEVSDILEPMNKILLGVVAILVIGGGAYFLMNGAPAGEQGTQNMNQESSADTSSGGAFSGSIADLSARGGEWKCTVDSSANTGAGQAISSGTVYVSGKSVRGDFTTSVQGFGTVESHMIADGSNVYVWSSAMSQGFKMNMTASGGSGSAATSGQGMDINQNYSYDCQPAQASASLFAPPANISFTAI
jgi:hypothetical protein